MARPVATDFIHSMRFQVNVVDGTRPGLQPPSESGRAQRAEAGFTTVSTPEVTVEAVEYKEGTMIYTRKFPGNATVADITCARGVARGDSSFWSWLRIVIEGSGEYRQDLQFKHFHREDALAREDPGASGAAAGSNLTQLDLDNPARIYHVQQAFPVRHKVAGDFDATASEISLMELDFAYENFEIEELGVAA